MVPIIKLLHSQLQGQREATINQKHDLSSWLKSKINEPSILQERGKQFLPIDRPISEYFRDNGYPYE